MSKGKSTGNASVKAASTKKGIRHLKGLTPNDLGEPQTPADHAALAVTCQFLGKTYYVGDRVCWDMALWVCTAQGWGKTGQSC